MDTERQHKRETVRVSSPRGFLHLGGWLATRIGIPDAGQQNVDEEGDDGVVRQQGWEGQDKRRDGGEETRG